MRNLKDTLQKQSVKIKITTSQHRKLTHGFLVKCQYKIVQIMVTKKLLQDQQVQELLKEIKYKEHPHHLHQYSLILNINQLQLTIERKKGIDLFLFNSLKFDFFFPQVLLFLSIKI